MPSKTALDETRIKEEFSKRLREFISDYLRITIKEFAEKVDIPQRTLQTYVSGSASPSAVALYKILQKYPKLNMNWLIAGQGEPLIQGVTTMPIQFIRKLKEDLKSIPVGKIMQLPFYNKIFDVLKGEDILDREELIALAEAIDKPIDEYLSLAGYLPNIFERSLKDRRLAGLLRNADKYSPKELDQLLGTFAIVLEGYESALRKQKSDSKEENEND